MGQPVKLSDELVLEARGTAKVAERSIAGQIEYWAQLGRALEPVLRGDVAMALRQSGEARSLSEAITTVDSEAGQKRVVNYLEERPYPHFTPHPETRGLLIRTEEDGTETIGRFVNRVFEASDV